MTSVLSPAVEGSYIRLEILLPAATSAVAMAALKVEFYGSVLAALPVTEERMIFFIVFTNSARCYTCKCCAHSY